VIEKIYNFLVHPQKPNSAKLYKPLQWYSLKFYPVALDT
jgi:hypothetical protein